MTPVYSNNSSLPSIPRWRVSQIPGIAIDFGGDFGGRNKKRVEAQISYYYPPSRSLKRPLVLRHPSQRESVSTLWGNNKKLPGNSNK
jgi:hypothetical protein